MSKMEAPSEDYFIPIEKNYLEKLDRLVTTFSPKKKLKGSRRNNIKRRNLDGFKNLTSSYLRRTSSKISTQLPKSSEVPSPKRKKTDQSKTITLPDVKATLKEFTFTGYDIDKDVNPKAVISHIDQSEKEKNGDKYKDACRMLGVVPISHLISKLSQNEIRICGYGLGSKCTRALAVALVENNCVQKLNLSENNIGSDGIRSVAEMLSVNESITELKVGHNDIQDEGACAICQSLRKNNKIRKLDLSGNQLRNYACSHISDMLETNYTLRELYLSHNLIEDPGGMILGDISAKNDTIEILDLSWNKIRVPGAIAISFGLSRNNSLKTLNLAWNGFSEKGSRAMGEALAKNKCLQELDLSSNRISMDATAFLVKGLQKNETLHTIKLCGNPITQKGAMLILQAIEKMTSSGINEIDIKDICVDGEFVELLNTLQMKRILRVRYGHVVRPIQHTVKKEVIPVFTGDPRALVFSLMEKDSLRVVDLFHRLISGNNFSVTREEFKAGILNAGLPVTEGQLDDLVDMMDDDGNGEVDLAELIAAERSYKRRKKKLQKLADSRQQVADLDLLSIFENNLSTPGSAVASDRSRKHSPAPHNLADNFLSPDRGYGTPTRSRKISAPVMLGDDLLNPERRSATPSRSKKTSAVARLGGHLPKINTD